MLALAWALGRHLQGPAVRLAGVAAQDDVREREMRTLFNLTRPEEYGRGDIDAVLELKGRAVPEALQGSTVPFELKSATGGAPDISTVRDFGLHHLEKWRPLHWIFGVYMESCSTASTARPRR